MNAYEFILNKVADLGIPVSSFYRTVKEIWATVLLDLFVMVTEGAGLLSWKEGFL